MRTKFEKYVLSLASVLMLLCFFLACSDTSNEDDPNDSSSGGVQDPNSSSSLGGTPGTSSGGAQNPNSSSSVGGGGTSSSGGGNGEPVQATTCANFVQYGSVPSNPYTACFRHTNSKCYVCDISSEGEFEGNVNTCASAWLWNNVQNVDDNLAQGFWYREVACPAGGTSSSSETTTPSSSSGTTNPGTCKANPATKAEIDACIDANWRAYGYASRPNKVIALTFDDGPHAGTGTLLSALAEKNVKATFFVIGSNIRANTAQAQAIHNAGHELGNHSDGYPNGAATIQSVNAGATAIQNITGSKPKVFRAPNLANVDGLASTGFPDIWGCNTEDYTNGTNTLNKVKANGCAVDGGFLLMHESNTSGQNTVPRIGDIIDWLRSQGYWMLTVSQVAIYKGVTPVAGQRYSKFP